MSGASDAKRPRVTVSIKEGADQETVRRAHVAADTLNRATELDNAGRREEACSAYDDVVAQFGGDGDPFRTLAVQASISKWLMLHRLHKPEAARTAFEEIGRFEPSVDEPKAYANHVRTLRGARIFSGNAARRTKRFWPWTIYSGDSGPATDRAWRRSSPSSCSTKALHCRGLAVQSRSSPSARRPRSDSKAMKTIGSGLLSDCS